MERQAYKASIDLDKAAILRGSRLVLRDFSLHARSGEIIWIKGANGSGKSTLLRAICGLLPIAAGSLAILGNLALTDEFSALDGDQSIDDALRFWGKFDGATGAAHEQALAAFDLVALAELPVRMLSHGQKRRAALARMVASGAPIWLLDEPYNGLDTANAARLNSALAQHANQGGISLLASHIEPKLDIARSYALGERKALAEAA